MSRLLGLRGHFIRLRRRDMVPRRPSWQLLLGDLLRRLSLWKLVKCDRICFGLLGALALMPALVGSLFLPISFLLPPEGCLAGVIIDLL